MNARSLTQSGDACLYHLSTADAAKGHMFSWFGIYNGIDDASRGLEFQGHVLSISQSRHLLPIMGASITDITDANYLEVNILDFPYADDSFGLVISDQVFEYVHGLTSVSV